MRYLQILVLSSLAIPAWLSPVKADERPSLRLLLLYGHFPPKNASCQALDPVLKEKLKASGVETRVAHYSEVSDELLAPFHVVLVMQEPSYGQSFLTEKDRAQYRKAVPVILDFVKKGGGLLVTHDANFNPQAQDCRLLNEALLAPLGAEILPETVVDPLRQFSHRERFISVEYFETSCLSDHPITAHVRSILIPVGPNSKVRDNVPIRTSDDWQVLIRGNPSAFSGGDGGENTPVTQAATYASAPPLAAVRSFGEGRVFLFAQPARIWFHSAFHRELGGLVYERGDGYRLILQALRYLAQPAMAKGRSADLPPEREKAPVRPKKHELSQTSISILLKRPLVDSVFLGAVGIEASCGSVRDYAAAAQKAGLSFIAFADDVHSLDDDQYAKLVRECEAVSTGGFLAIPGIRFTNDAGLSFMALDVPHLPTQQVMNQSPLGSHDVRTLNSCMPYAPIYGHRTGFPPFGLRFWDAVDVFAHVNGELYDDSSEWYRRIAGNMQEVIPIASQRVESPAHLGSQLRWKTGVIAPEIANVRELLRQGRQKTFITEGPLIRQFSILNVNYAPLGGRWYATTFWKVDDRLALNVRASSAAPLRKVTVYQGEEIFRQFYPKGNEFEEIVWFTPSKDGSFYMEVEDESGKRAISSPLLLRNFFKRFNWCTDQQNLICWNYAPEEDPEGAIAPGTYGFNVSHNPGRGDVLEPNLPAHEVYDAPPGREINMGGIAPKFTRVMAWPKFVGPEASEEILYQNRLLFCSEDAYVLDLEWNGQSRNPLTPRGAQMFEWKSRLINPRGRPGEPNFWLIETEVKILKDIQLGETEGPELVLFEAFCPASLAKEWPTYVACGRDGKVRGDTLFADAAKITLPVERLAPGGYTALVSNPWFSPALYALDGGDYVTRIGNAKEVLGLGRQTPSNGGNVQIGRELPNQKIPAGTSWKSRFLFAVACRQDTDEATFDRIRSAYSLAGKPGLAVEMHKGRLLSQIFDVLLEAENSAAVAEFGKASLPSCLLVRTRQLNPNWDAVVVDMETALWKRMGIYETTGLTTLRCDQPQKLFLGHPYAGSHPAVRIALKQWEPDFVELEVHNPTSEPVSFAVSSQDALAALFPKMDETVVTLAPGETRLISQRRHSLEAKR